MPALSYKARFVDLVVSGAKPHSIRAWRKRPFKVGDVISHFTGSRFQPRRIRPNTICTAARCIEINTGLALGVGVYGFIYIAGEKLTAAQVDQLAKADGFASAEEFFLFFRREHGQRVSGQLIEWNPHAAVSGVFMPRGHGEETALGASASVGAATPGGTRRRAK